MGGNREQTRRWFEFLEWLGERSRPRGEGDGPEIRLEATDLTKSFVDDPSDGEGDAARYRCLEVKATTKGVVEARTVPTPEGKGASR